MLRQHGGADPVCGRGIRIYGSERITGRRGFVFAVLAFPIRKQTLLPAGETSYGAFFTGDLRVHWSTLDLLVPFNVQAATCLWRTSITSPQECTGK